MKDYANQTEYYIEKTEQFGDKQFHCHEQTLAPHESIEPHIHDWVEVLYCVEGTMRVLLGNTSEELYEGSLIIVPINEVHLVESTCDRRCHYIVIKFSLDLLFSIVDENDYDCILPFLVKGNADDCLFHSEALEPAGIDRLVFDILQEFRQRSYGYRLALRAHVYRFVLFAIRYWKQDTVKQPVSSATHRAHIFRIFDAIFYIQQNYSEDITLTAMSKRFHISYSYFSRQFSAVTGQNFAAYLCSVRLSAAERLLVSTDTPVTSIAFQVGFSDASYFTRRFSQKNGMTPNVYRKRYSTLSEK